MIPKDEYAAFDFSLPFSKWFGWGLVRKHFCPVMVRRGLCGYEHTASCEKCQGYLAEAHQLKTPRKSPVGLFIWKLRDAAAKAADDHQVIPPPKPVSREEVNLFNRLMEELDESTPPQS